MYCLPQNILICDIGGVTHSIFVDLVFPSIRPRCKTLSSSILMIILVYLAPPTDKEASSVHKSGTWPPY